METNPLMARILEQTIIIMHNEVDGNMLIINKIWDSSAEI